METKLLSSSIPSLSASANKGQNQHNGEKTESEPYQIPAAPVTIPAKNLEFLKKKLKLEE